MKNKIMIIVFAIISLCILTNCINVYADDSNSYNACVNSCENISDASQKTNCKNACKNNNPNQAATIDVEEIKDCQSLLGDPNDPNGESLAWLIQQILNYAKYAGIFLVLVLSSIDFAKTIIANDDDNMKKAQKRLIYRLIAVVFLFFVPTLVMVILNIFGLTTDPTCGLS